MSSVSKNAKSTCWGHCVWEAVFCYLWKYLPITLSFQRQSLLKRFSRAVRIEIRKLDCKFTCSSGSAHQARCASQWEFLYSSRSIRASCEHNASESLESPYLINFLLVIEEVTDYDSQIITHRLHDCCRENVGFLQKNKYAKQKKSG